ncbi:DUF294 nucleotidyltransferase-like domain-containing protein [Calidifontibacillus erzurumensis]|uniref:DUF294 nucleotidyltransferase-like domain-containing protein n=1 Tax=Calidifontibacillus erzurumensis TaxID=2741433 RepID=UPI0035B4FF86
MRQRLDKFDKQAVYEQIKGHPFFKGVPFYEAQKLMDKCVLKRFETNELIYQASQPREGLLLLLEGMAEVFIFEDEGTIEALEVISKGELVGFPSLADFLGVSKSNKYEEMVRVKALEPCFGILIPYSVIEERFEDVSVRDYLLQQCAMRLKDIYTSLAEQVKITRRTGESDRFIVRVKDVMSPLVAVEKDATIQEVAVKMKENKTDAVLVLETGKLTGIVTKSDLVNRVLAQSKPYDLEVGQVMTKNPETIARLEYYYAALTSMVLGGYKHLPVVHERTGEAVGIVSLGSLLRKKNESLVKAIRNIERIEEEQLPTIKQAIYKILETLIGDNVPVSHILKVITELNDRLMVRCVQLAVDSLRNKKGMTPPVDFCWYMMGSAGRSAQFMMTDQDHFLVYEDGEEGQRDLIEHYFALLGEEIVIFLERAGFARCKGNMMASAPNWRGSLKTWETRLRQWMLQATNENIMLAQNFFSYRFLYGNLRLNEKFQATITEQLERSKIFLYRMAQVEKEHQVPTLDHPIRSLFKLDRKQIDIKKDILFPFYHSLQILSLAYQIFAGTPMERIDYLVQKKVLTENLAVDLKTAYNETMSVYVKQKWNQYKRGESTSSVLTFTHLTTREKEELILTLKTVRELQSLMLSEFSI